MRQSGWIVTNTRTGIEVTIYNLAEFYRKMNWTFPIWQMYTIIAKEKRFQYNSLEITGAGHSLTDWAIVELGLDSNCQALVTKESIRERRDRIFPHLAGRPCFGGV